jgi:hypothetical protein
MGASETKTIDHVAIARADLLASDSTTGIVVRGARQSRFLPNSISGLKLWLDANINVTTVSGAVSQWDDLSGSGNHATQGTAGNRPYLTRYDNKENAAAYNNTLANALWNKTTYPVSVADNFTTNYLGESIAAKVTATAGTTRHGPVNVTNRLRVALGEQYIFAVDVKKSNFRYLWVGDQSDSPWHGINFDLDTGLYIGSGNQVTSKTSQSLGSGWYRLILTFTSAAGHFPGCGVWFGSGANDTSPPSIAAVGTEEFYICRAQVRRATTDDYYLATPADAILAGINSNRTIIFDGNDDNLQTALAVNPTGGMWGAFSITPHSLSSDNLVFSAYANIATDRIAFYILSNGALLLRIFSNASVYIGRSTAAAAVAVSTKSIISWTYDGGTSSSGIKIYKNGVQIDTTDNNNSVYAVPTAGRILEIGSRNSGTAQTLKAYLDEFIFQQGGTISAGDRAKVEEYLTDKWTLAASLGDFSFAANAGQNTEDYLDTFATSSAFRYWWVELTNNASKKFTHSKLFIGQSVDLGDTIDSISCVKEVQTSSNFESSAGSTDSSKSYDDPYIVRITWRGVTDTQINDFATRVGKNNAARKGMFLATVDNHDILDGLKCIYVKLKSYSVNDQVKNNYNTITAEFEEIVG